MSQDKQFEVLAEIKYYTKFHVTARSRKAAELEMQRRAALINPYVKFSARAISIDDITQ